MLCVVQEAYIWLGLNGKVSGCVRHRELVGSAMRLEKLDGLFADLRKIKAALSAIRSQPDLWERERPTVNHMLGTVLPHITRIGLPQSLKRLLRLGGGTNGSLAAQDFEQVSLGVDELALTIQDELGDKFILLLENEKAPLLTSSHPFGAKVSEAFPSAATDILEAARCLALERYTASVFHSMRVAELGLKSLLLCLDLPEPKSRNWGTYLGAIREERVRRGGVKWPDSEFFQDVYARFDAIKDAQRNPTMHLESVHTGEEAKLIYDSTKALLERLANRVNESGLPRAAASQANPPATSNSAS